MFILNKSNELIDLIIEKINKAKEIYLSISFISESGLLFLKDKINIKNKMIKVITTTDDFITDYKALEILFKNDIETKLINKNLLNLNNNQRQFHTKFIIFKNQNDEFELINGSLNFTNNSFFNKFETITFSNIISNKNDCLKIFDYLWNQGFSLSQSFLDKYKIQYQIFQTLNNLYNQNLNKGLKLLEPNQMQMKVLNELNNLWIKNEKTALLWSATGTGKTILSAFAANQFQFKKVLFIVHNRIIISSAKSDYNLFFKKFDKKIIEIFPNNSKRTDKADIVFTTEKTLKKFIENKSDFLNQFDFFIFDEAHKIGEANIQDQIFQKIKETKIGRYFILGMTATPHRSDNPYFVIEKFKNIIGKITIDIAIDNDLISPFHYYGIDIESEKIKNNDLQIRINKMVQNLEQNKPWDDKKIKGIIFVSTIEEAEKVMELVNETKFNSIAISSKDSKDQNEISELINELQDDSSNLNFFVTINQFNEGVDIPNLNTIVMFRFTESSIIYTQQIGRGLRRVNENKFLNIFDLVGNDENGFNRLLGLKGKFTENPKKLEKELKEFGKSTETNQFNGYFLEKKAIEKILSKLSKFNYSKYFQEKIFEETKLMNTSISLLNIEEVLNESIQIISNNIRDKKNFKLSNKNWIWKLYKMIDPNLEEINSEEHILLELFSWMPLTTSTPLEKQLILKLINGEEIIMKNKWISYFLGKNIVSNNDAQIIRGDFSNYFKFEKVNDQNCKLKFIMENSFSNTFFKILEQIKIYLQINKDKDDYLVNEFWYSKAEISFMAGYVLSQIKGKFSNSNEEIFLTNSINENSIKNTSQIIYKNEIVNKNEFIVSNDDDSVFEDNQSIHMFLGKAKFNNGKKIFKYLGTGKMNINLSYLDKIENETKSYNRFTFKTKQKLSDEDFIYLSS